MRSDECARALTLFVGFTQCIYTHTHQHLIVIVRRRRRRFCAAFCTACVVYIADIVCAHVVSAVAAVALLSTCRGQGRTLQTARTYALLPPPPHVCSFDCSTVYQQRCGKARDTKYETAQQLSLHAQRKKNTLQATSKKSKIMLGALYSTHLFVCYLHLPAESYR